MSGDRKQGAIVVEQAASLSNATGQMPVPSSGGDHTMRDADLAARVVALEAGYGGKKQLARILNSPTSRRRLAALVAGEGATGEKWRASPLGQPALEALWNAAARLTDALLQIDPTRLREACGRWIGGRAAPAVAAMWLGTDGVRARAARQAAFFRERSGCEQDPTPARVHALARATPGFADDLAAEVGIFRRAMRELRAHARAPLELHVYGFGEISRTVGLVRRPSPLAHAVEPQPLVYKRLAPFPNRELAEQYVAVYDEYNRRLREDVGIAVPDFGHRALVNGRGQVVILDTQARLDPRSIGKAIMRQRDAEQCRILFRLVLAEYRKLIRYNRAQAASGFAIGIDGQITNWAVRDYPGDDVPLRGNEGLIYVDTNTPMMRRHGRDCLPMTFYLQALPRLLRPLLRPLARRVLDRYFNPRVILLDFLGNTSIHGRNDLVDVFLPDGNAFLGEGLIEPTPRPITRQEVERYIASDVATWRLTRSVRKLEEMLQGERGPTDTINEIRWIYTHPIF